VFWVRTRLRFGACCALLALAMQLALAFGHTHCGKGAAVFAAQAHSVAAPGRLQAKPAAPDVPIGPAQPAFHYCEICLVTNLAGSGIPATAPSLSLPLVAEVLTFLPNVEGAPRPYPLHPLQARAPPHA
jgi:hypothetical protein